MRSLGGSRRSRTKVHKAILDNGLTVLLIEDRRCRLVSIQLFVRAGSIYEDKYLGTGVSHFVEHVIDDGTPTRSRADIDRLIEKMGNVSNAYTWRDHTKYYHTVPTEHFPLALELMADYIQNPTFPPEEVEIQRGVILNEFNKDNDEPTRRLLDAFYETAFRVHPVRIPVGGYPELFEKLTREDLIDYYEMTYSPDNMVLVVAGDIDVERAFEMVSRLFEPFKRRKPFSPNLPQEPPQVAMRERVITGSVEMAYGVMGFHTVDVFHEDALPLEIIATALGTGESSRISRIVKDQKRLIYSCDTWSDTPPYDAGIWAVEFDTDPEKLEEAKEAILKEIFRVRSEGLTKGEMEKAKAIIESEYIFSNQSIEEIASTVGNDEFATGDPHFTERFIERIRSVTQEDILRAAERYFREENLTVTVMIPDRLGSRSRVILSSGGCGRCSMERERLENGARLLICADDSFPVVSVNVVMPGGSKYEPPEKSGSFQLMSKMLLKGTKSRTAQQIAEEIESVGASLDPFCGREFFGCSATMLADDLEFGLEMLFDVLSESIFDPEEFAKLKEEAIAEIKAEADDWVTLSKNRFYETAFGDRAHEFYPIGRLASVQNLTVADVMDLYHRFCAPTNAVISVFGDVDPQKVRRLIEEGMAKWAREAQPLPDFPPPVFRPAKRTFHEEIYQEVVFIGYPAVPISSADRYPIKVLTAILVGVDYPGGRLYNRLRNEQLVYLVHGYTYFGIDMGYIAVYAATGQNGAEQALRVMIEEMERVAEGEIGEEELESGKNMCISSHRLNLQTLSDRSAAAALSESYGIGYDQFLKFEERISEIGVEDVRRVAGEILDGSRRAIAILKPRSR